MAVPAEKVRPESYCHSFNCRVLLITLSYMPQLFPDQKWPCCSLGLSSSQLAPSPRPPPENLLIVRYWYQICKFKSAFKRFLIFSILLPIKPYRYILSFRIFFKYFFLIMCSRKECRPYVHCTILYMQAVKKWTFNASGFNQYGL